MTIEVDALDSVTGWTGTAAVTLNDHPNLCAGYKTHSLIIYFGASGQSTKKTFSTAVDITGANDITFQVWKRGGESVGPNPTEADLPFSVCFGGSEYLFQGPKSLEPVTISAAGLTSIPSIEFKSQGGTGYLIVSWMVATKDQFPLDIFSAYRTGILAEVSYWAILFPTGGLVTCTAGDQSIVISTGKWLDRYAAVTITDGILTETHQLTENDAGEYKLGGRFDGPTMINSFTGASVYLTIPVDWGMSEKEIVLPSITLWGMNPEPILRSSKLEQFDDTTVRGAGLQERQDGQIQKYKILIDLEGRESQMDVLAQAAQYIRAFVAKERLWINGYRHYLEWQGAPEWIDPTGESDQIFKLQYSTGVEVKESIWSRLPVVRGITDTVDAAVTNA